MDDTGHDAQLALLARQSVGRSHASYTYGGHQYALAIDAATQVSVHRPDLVTELPRTWADVLELAGEGRVLWPGKPVDAMSSFLTLAAQRGGAVCSDKERFVGREVGLAVLDLLHQLVDRVGPSCLGDNPIDVADRLASTDDRCYAPLVFGYVNYSRKGFRPHRLAYRDVPVGPGGWSGPASAAPVSPYRPAAPTRRRPSPAPSGWRAQTFSETVTTGRAASPPTPWRGRTRP